MRELFSKLVSLVGVGRITSKVHHFVFEVDGAMIKFDLAVILVIRIFFVLLDDDLDSPGFDVVKILFVFWQAFLVSLEEYEDSVFPYGILTRRPEVGNLGLSV